MGRGMVVRGVKDFLKEPYLPIIELFMDTKNSVLQLKELRYLLLEDHELKMITGGTTRGENLVGEKIFFRDGEKSFKVVRSILQREGGMLRNTTGKNKDRPMNANGLNKLLQTMKGGTGPKILEKVKGGYRLIGKLHLQFVRMEREKRIKECPVDMVAELRHGIAVYNMGSDDDTVKELEGEKDELYGLTRTLSEMVVQVWAKQKIDLFVKKLKRLRSVHGNGNFLGYCTEMVRWFVGSLGLEEVDFREEQGEILKIVKDKRARAAARKYGKKIRACKEGLKNAKTDIAIPSPGAEKGRAIGSADVVEVSMLSIPSILSAEEDIAVDEVIQVLVGGGMIGKAEGKLLLLDQEMSKLYRKHGLNEYLSSTTFDEEPIIVIDSH